MSGHVDTVVIVTVTDGCDYGLDCGRCIAAGFD